MISIAAHTVETKEAEKRNICAYRRSPHPSFIVFEPPAYEIVLTTFRTDLFPLS